jgi:hypothetical protein
LDFSRSLTWDSPDIVWPRRNAVLLIDYLPVGVFKAYFCPCVAYLGIVVGQCSQVSSLLLLRAKSLSG